MIFLRKITIFPIGIKNSLTAMGGNWTVQTHSFYNDSDCFTIHIEVQRGIDFWYTSRFSTERTELCKRKRVFWNSSNQGIRRRIIFMVIEGNGIC